MTNDSEIRDLEVTLDTFSSTDHARVYAAKIPPVLRLQRKGRPDEFINEYYGIELRPEHRMKLTIGDPKVIAVAVAWEKAPSFGKIDHSILKGSLTLQIKGIEISTGASSNWQFELDVLLRWMAENWARIFLEEGETAVNDNAVGINFVSAFSSAPARAIVFRRFGSMLQVSHNLTKDTVIPFPVFSSFFHLFGKVLFDRLVWLRELGAIKPDNDGLTSAWENRATRTPAEIVNLATPSTVSERTRKWLTGKLAGETSLDSLGRQPRQLLAAARMAQGLPPEGQEAVLAAFESVKFEPINPELAKLSERAVVQYEVFQKEALRTIGAEEARPVYIGYKLAMWFRTHIAMRDDAPADPRWLLSRWGVSIRDVDNWPPEIDAAACWSEGAQPVIFLNKLGNHSRNEASKRASLAHEICHILVDRETYFPLGEVLGGAVPKRIEKIARGFQAEFLVLREVAWDIYRLSSSARTAVDQVVQRYNVSAQLAANQILNAGRFINAADREFLERIVPGRS